MKKLISILVIIFASLLITREALSLPNCEETDTLSAGTYYWNNCFGASMKDGFFYVVEWKNGVFHGEGAIFLSPLSSMRYQILPIPGDSSR